MCWVIGAILAFLGFRLGLYIQINYPALAAVSESPTLLGTAPSAIGATPMALAVIGFFAGMILWHFIESKNKK